MSSAGRHALHFYRSDEQLVRVVSGFARAGLRAKRPTLLVPSDRHRSMLTAELKRLGVEVRALEKEGRLVVASADERARLCVSEGSTSALWGRLQETLAEARSRSATVSIWGETSDRLRELGHRKLFLELEKRWQKAVAAGGIDLLCSSRCDLLDPDAYAGPVRDACATHTELLEPEDAAELEAADAALREALGGAVAQVVDSSARADASLLPAASPVVARMLWACENIPRSARLALSRAAAAR